MSASLIIDFGNTRAKIAVFDEAGTMLRFWQRKTIGIGWLQKLFEQHRISRTMLCSVVAHNPAIEIWLQSHSDLTIFGHTTPLPIRLLYTTPHTLGKDRIAGACGAWLRFAHQNTLVIDAGTCLKYDFVTAEGNHVGGSIAPGIGMRLRAMHDYTAKLPLLEKQPLPDFVGHDTETALRTGAQLGAALEAQGFADLYERRYGSRNILVTGGDASYLMPYLPKGAIEDKYLIINGLYGILKIKS